MTIALLGQPERAYARMHRPNLKVRGESLAHIVYAYPGASALVDIAWQDRGVARGSALFLGERGSACLEGSMGRGASARFRMVQDGQVVVDETRSPWDDYCQSFYLFQREFVDCIRAGTPVTQSGDANLRTLETTFAAYASSREGRLVDVAEFAHA
jgi:predicted dehydrogenase